MRLADVTLEDKYVLEDGRIYVTGSQALARLPMLQRSRDATTGLHTGGFISGYRGSPLGGYDLALWQASKYLREHHIHFQPGVNEDLAATAIWGTQQVGLNNESDYDGVFAIWYGKGPGVDRSGDVFKHGNIAGTSPHGGVLVLFGDDHLAKSSTVPHQSEPALIAASIPILNPANIQEYLDYGLAAFAMSRFSGCWVGMKCVTETVEGSASVIVNPYRMQLINPPDFQLPPDGVHLRFPDALLVQEERLLTIKLPAAQAFVRANGLDRISHDLPVNRRRIGIVSTGKAWANVAHALDLLGIDDAAREALGLSVYKVAMPWPLEPQGITEFARGHEELLVIEEKRGLIEEQLASILYHLESRPRLTGKQDEHGATLLPAHGDFTADELAPILARRLLRLDPPQQLAERFQRALQQTEPKEASQASIDRMPYFCAGCPHNSSTHVPEGSRAFAGIGCHFMSVFMNRRTQLFTHMGGEGAQWIGQAPFSKDKHVFQNLGDGTYYHSGSLAVRAAVAAKVNITYKILFNDAVAMTGGQPVDGQQTPWGIAQQMHAEGVKRIVIVTDEPDKYPAGTPWPPGATIHHRRELDALQRELRETPGTTILIYDQTCAAEKRRRRKRGTYPDPAKRVFINEAVCEGCGDCGITSNCVAVKPLETEFGRKRRIDQSSCNKDYSCVEGFCPSFVTVYGAEPRRTTKPVANSPATAINTQLTEPELPSVDSVYNILVAGIGGTGVVTIGALLGMAAHLEGKGISVLDQTGLAQKNGAVTSHIRIASDAAKLHGSSIGKGETDLVLGCDMVVAAGASAQATYAAGRTKAVINNQVVPLAIFAMNPDLPMEKGGLVDGISTLIGKDNAAFVAATQLATTLMGDAIYSNAFLMGYAWQQGLIPLSRQALERAIELNGAAVEQNKQAFQWGRLAAHDLAKVQQAASSQTVQEEFRKAEDLDEIIRIRAEHLTGYQNVSYARRYESLVRRVQSLEAERLPGETALTRAVAQYYAKLLAYKDEYEVARLYVRPEFRQQLEAQFEGERHKLRVHMAPPLLARRDPLTGKPRKMEFGPWVFTAFGLLARLRFLRGSAFDPFGYTKERKTERQLIKDYEKLVDELLQRLSPDNHELAVELASLPKQIRGFGHVKERHLAAAKKKEQELLARLNSDEREDPVAAQA